MEVERSNKDKIILHLCASEFGSDSKPYRDAGYDVRCITKEIGVENYHPPKNVYGIIANPPCTMFSTMKMATDKTKRDLREGMRLVQECLRVIWEAQYDTPLNSRTPHVKFWTIENPATGMLKHFLGRPPLIFHPWEYGDNYTKQTALWGKFNLPQKLKAQPPTDLIRNPVKRDRKIAFIRDRQMRTDLRSIASPYFTKAFFEANP